MSARGVRRAWRCLAAPPLVALSVLAGCDARPGGGDTPPQRLVVEIRGMAFEPAMLAVAPGDTVVWINRDIVPHTSTAEASGGWDTGIIAQGDSARWVADRSGQNAYICTLHPTMRGGVTVTEPSHPQ